VPALRYAMPKHLRRLEVRQLTDAVGTKKWPVVF